MGQENENRLLREGAGFMNNERLYNMIENLKENQNEIIVEVKKNNHIKDEVAELKTKVNENTDCLNSMLSEQEGKEYILAKIRDYGGWIVAIIMALLQLLESGVI